MPASCKRTALVAFILVNSGELAMIDLRNCLLERQLYCNEERAVFLVYLHAALELGIAEQPDRLVDYFAQRRFDHEHAFFVQTGTLNQLGQHGLKGIGPIAEAMDQGRDRLAVLRVELDAGALLLCDEHEAQTFL